MKAYQQKWIDDIKDNSRTVGDLQETCLQILSDDTGGTDELSMLLATRLNEILECMQAAMVAKPKPTQPVKMANGDIENFTLRIGGKAYRCPCGCNVFHKPDDTNLLRYQCNACEHLFECE